MRYGLMILILITVVLTAIDAAPATGLGSVGPRSFVSPEEGYCINSGGTPNSGKCLFPDGSYCDLKAFYNGTCPDRAYIEQRLWEAEAINFLNSDYCPGCGGTGAVSYPAAGYPATSYPAVSYSPGSAAYWQNLGNSMYAAGRYNESVIYYQSAVQVEPTLAEAWMNMGNALFFLGRYGEALNAYDRATLLRPDWPGAWNGKGWALKALGREAEANQAFARAGTAPA